MINEFSTYFAFHESIHSAEKHELKGAIKQALYVKQLMESICSKDSNNI